MAAAAKHVSYEITMLVHAGEQLRGSHSSPPAGAIGDDENMALESFLVHYRNLRAFLCPSIQPIKNDDILASDFLREPNESDHGDKIRLEKHKERIDQMLAHLSYKREQFIEASDYEWKVAEMRESILGQLEVFFGLLSPTERSWFPDAQFIAKSKARAAAQAQASLGVFRTQQP